MALSQNITNRWVILGGTVIVIGAFIFLAPPPVVPAAQKITRPPAVSEKQLRGEEPLRETEAQRVGAYRTLLLGRIAESQPLTDEEKGAIGTIMLTQAQLYQFTDEERGAIFARLRTN